MKTASIKSQIYDFIFVKWIGVTIIQTESVFS